MAILPGVDITVLCGPLIVADTDGERLGYALRGTAVLPCEVEEENDLLPIWSF